MNPAPNPIIVAILQRLNTQGKTPTARLIGQVLRKLEHKQMRTLGRIGYLTTYAKQATDTYQCPKCFGHFGQPAERKTHRKECR